MRISKEIKLLFLLIFLMSSFQIFTQQKSYLQIQNRLNNLYKNADKKGLEDFTKTELKNFEKPLPEKDSFTKTTLLYYKYIAQNNLPNYNRLDSLDKAILYCPKTNKGDSLQALVLNSKAYDASNSGKPMLAYKTVKKSVEILEKIPNTNAGVLMGNYLLLSNLHAYYGNYDEAKSFMRLAEKVYENHQKFIDDNTWELNGNHQRLIVIAKYRKIYMLKGLYDKKEDSIAILNTTNELEKLHNQPNFHPEERLYYTTALNHVGDWFISKKHDSIITKKEVDLGLQYLQKALHFVENKNYAGTTWSLKYNLAKGYIKGNQLEKADEIMNALLSQISEKDSRFSFFCAQKGQIKAKQNEKDSALYFFEKAVTKVHNDTVPLEANYENFVPNNRYNNTKLLLRIAEELHFYYSKDSVVQNRVTRLHFMALKQFENSYLNTSYNSKQDQELRQIIKGILRFKKTGFHYKNDTQKSILNRLEILKNQLAWKRFYESRYTNVLPKLDSIKKEEIILGNALSNAKISNKIKIIDSIKRLVAANESFKKKNYPQLELVSNFNFSIDAFQQSLTKEDLVLKYVILQDEIALYQISKDDFSVITIPWKKSDEEELINLITPSKSIHYNDEMSAKISKLILPKFDENIKNIIINPDGILYKIPFEILKLNEQFLIENYNIRYTSNLGFVNFKTENKTKSYAHIYAPNYIESTSSSETRNTKSNLAGAKSEANQISTILPSIIYNDENLTKKTFITTAKNATVLHLAMHAEVNENYPELSRLLFSDNPKNEDEQLYLEEFYGLSLKADLAVLSACNTGVGFEKNGSLASFQRAFTFAGVPATVASLWEVPDAATAAIMVSFYKNLKSGQSKSEALKNAKLTYIENHKNTKLASPFFWAGFVVYGSDNPILEEKNITVYWIIFVIILIGLLLFFLIKKRKQTK